MFSVVSVCVSVYRRGPLCTGPQSQLCSLYETLPLRHIQTCSDWTSVLRQEPLDMFKLVQYVARAVRKAGGWDSTQMYSYFQCTYYINLEVPYY